MVLWRLLSLFSTFALPQLLGVLLYFRLVRFSRWLAFALGVLTPGLLFFYLAPSFFFAGLREATNNSCGMPALGAAVMLLFGTAVQFVVALIVQLWVFCRK